MKQEVTCKEQLIKQNQNQKKFKSLWNNLYERKRKIGQITIVIQDCQPRKVDSFWVINNKYRQFRPLNGVQKTMLYQHEELKKLYLKFEPKQTQNGQQECWFRLKGQSNILFYLDFDTQKMIHLYDTQQENKIIGRQSENEKFQQKQSSQEAEIESKKQLKQQQEKLKSYLEEKLNHHVKIHGKSTQLQIIFINRSPLCKTSSVFTLDLDQRLPQFLSSDKLIFRILKIFDVFPNIKVAFNSLGGGASVNNLHFHLFFTNQMINEQSLPIQLAQKNLFIQINSKKLTNLSYKEVYCKRELKQNQKSKQLNQFKMGIKVQYIDNPNQIGQCFVFSPLVCQNEKQCEKSEISMSLSSTLIVFIDILTIKKIPFNVLFSKSGTKIYLMIRNYSCNDARFGFMQASGVIFGSKDTTPQKIKQQKRLLLIKTQIVQDIKNMIKTILQ